MEVQTSSSRRQFLSTIAMTAGAGILRPRQGWSDTTDPRVGDIVAKTIGIDTHNHIDVPLTAGEMPGPDIDLVGETKRSGLSAICMTFATDYQPGDAYERFLKGLASMDRQLERNGIKRSLTLADVRTAHENKQLTVIQAVEGGHFLRAISSGWQKPTTGVCGTLGCFTTVTLPCHWAMFTPTRRALAD